MAHRTFDGPTFLTNLLIMAAAIAVVIVTALLAGGQVSGKVVRLWAPTASAMVATAGLLTTFYTYNRSARNQRRSATYEAWETWATETVEPRRIIGASDGQISRSDGGLLWNWRLTSQREAKNEWERLQIDRSHHLVNVSNGLERLGAGVRTGLYELNALEQLGGRTIVNLWNRYFEFYVHARLVQDTAYVEFQALAQELARRQNLRFLKIPDINRSGRTRVPARASRAKRSALALCAAVLRRQLFW